MQKAVLVPLVPLLEGHACQARVRVHLVVLVCHSGLVHYALCLASPNHGAGITLWATITPRVYRVDTWILNFSIMT